MLKHLYALCILKALTGMAHAGNAFVVAWNKSIKVLDKVVIWVCERIFTFVDWCEDVIDKHEEAVLAAEERLNEAIENRAEKLLDHARSIDYHVAVSLNQAEREALFSAKMAYDNARTRIRCEYGIKGDKARARQKAIVEKANALRATKA